MKKFIIEFFVSVLIILIPTFVVYYFLKGVPSFWEEQFLWSVVLAIGWVIVAAGYYHQGWLVHRTGNSADVSIVLPATVFFVQCVLFVKGIHYNDWSLVWGALVVNSGVVFSSYNILKSRKIL